MELPFDEKFEDGFYVRTFSEDLIEEDLQWHWDKESRIVVCESDTDWLFQYDNQLPIKLQKNKPIYISEGEYHRLIKGTGNLTLKVKKLISEESKR